MACAHDTPSCRSSPGAVAHDQKVTYVVRRSLYEHGHAVVFFKSRRAADSERQPRLCGNGDVQRVVFSSFFFYYYYYLPTINVGRDRRGMRSSGSGGRVAQQHRARYRDGNDARSHTEHNGEERFRGAAAAAAAAIVREVNVQRNETTSCGGRGAI